MNLTQEPVATGMGSAAATKLAGSIAAALEGGRAAFPLWVADELLFTSIDGAVALVDTGSPLTIAIDEAATSWITDAISRYIGEKPDHLLGMDVLGRFGLTFDLEAGLLEFEQLEQEFLDPVVFAGVAGRRLRCILDSGASITYVPGEVLHGSRPAGEFHDFLPGHGAFTVVTHKCPIVLGDLAYRDCVAALPAILQALRERLDLDGIIGNRILREQRVRLGPQGIERVAEPSVHC